MTSVAHFLARSGANYKGRDRTDGSNAPMCRALFRIPKVLIVFLSKAGTYIVWEFSGISALSHLICIVFPDGFITLKTTLGISIQVKMLLVLCSFEVGVNALLSLNSRLGL